MRFNLWNQTLFRDAVFEHVHAKNFISGQDKYCVDQTELPESGIEVKSGESVSCETGKNPVLRMKSGKTQFSCENALVGNFVYLNKI